MPLINIFKKKKRYEPTIAKRFTKEEREAFKRQQKFERIKAERATLLAEQKFKEQFAAEKEALAELKHPVLKKLGKVAGGIAGYIKKVKERRAAAPARPTAHPGDVKGEWYPQLGRKRFLLSPEPYNPAAVNMSKPLPKYPQKPIVGGEHDNIFGKDKAHKLDWVKLHW